MEDINEKIVHYSRQLRLPGFRKNYQSLQEEMSGDKMDYNDYLSEITGDGISGTQRAPEKTSGQAGRVP